jgi:hypothetical protein
MNNGKIGFRKYSLPFAVFMNAIALSKAIEIKLSGWSRVVGPRFFLPIQTRNLIKPDIV